MTNRTTRRRTARVAIALAAAGIGITACAPQPRGDDNSHHARYSQAVYASYLRNTRVVVAVGWNDPADGPARKSVDVSVTQSWCDGTTLIERSLTGARDDYAGVTDPAQAYSIGFGGIDLAGTETSTPAGENCTAPDPAAATAVPRSFAAFVLSTVTGGGDRVSYTRDDGGEFTYEDAGASGALVLPETDGWFGFESQADEPGETWLWEAFWADARGVDVASALPAA